jgi:glycosyltransferase involved in cell wall biosynthesis
MLISLIIPTINRLKELEQFLSSLRDQQLGSHFSFQDIEVIIVDQNPDDCLLPVIEKFKSQFAVIHLRERPSGQSHAKNVGLRVSRGEYIAYPDDDCIYDPTTLEIALFSLRSLPSNTCIFGKSLHPISRREIFSSPYPKERFSIQHPHDPRILLAIQYCQFYPRTIAGNLEFDEEFCSGSTWGSGEETDHLIRFLERGGQAEFVPELVVYHPFQGHFEVPEQKLIRYAEGFGALCKKHGLHRILLVRSMKLLLASLFFMMSFQLHKSHWCYLTFINRLKGFQAYPNKKI